MKRKVLYFTAPKQVEIREESLPALGADSVLVETTCSAISAGTEMLIYQGRFPRDLEADSVIPSLREGFRYPLAYGYASVGVVRETGTQVEGSFRDKPVFAFQPHASHYICKADSLFLIPSSLSPDSACFLANMETAVNLVQDAAPLFGERVLVLGQGIVGLLTASLLCEYPLDALVAADRYARRREASPVSPASVLDPDAPDFREGASSLLQGGADLTLELSGRPETLNDALALTGFCGRIVIGSWYGEKRAEIDLGGAFHRSRIRLVSSQVSTIAPGLSGRWDKKRRFDVVWKALERIKPEKWITHHFSIDRAEEAYKLLDEAPQETIQVLIHYDR